MGENIGMAARAMLNCGLKDLRLVNPRDGWPNQNALAASSAAKKLIEGAKLFSSSAEAIADLEIIYAATARPRDMTIEVYTPGEAVRLMLDDAASDIHSGILFGKESMGLKNDDLSLANAVITAPLNPKFTSLNLAQAVFLMSYEWFQLCNQTHTKRVKISRKTHPASKSELLDLFDHLEGELDASGFFHVREKRPIMVRNIRNILQRARLTEQEVRTVRGILTSLAKKGGS